jgi:phage tail sheath protein FI
MPEYLYPGVYIEEIERGPRPIEGVPTSTAAFLGEAERGSITPRLVTSSASVLD